MNVGVTGHRSIPIEARSVVATKVKKILDGVVKPLQGISSLAAGADQLFAQWVIEAGGSLRVILPSRGYADTFTIESDRRRYSALLNQAVDVDVLPYDTPSEAAFLEAGQRIVDESELLIAIWDGQPARGRGGTADVVRYAEARQIPIQVVWPVGVRR